jgi:hypothetical protein
MDRGFSNLKMETVNSSETLVNLYWITRSKYSRKCYGLPSSVSERLGFRYLPGDRIRSMRSYMVFLTPYWQIAA